MGKLATWAVIQPEQMPNLCKYENEDNPINEDNLKKEDNDKNEDDLNIKTTYKMKTTSTLMECTWCWKYSNLFYFSVCIK